jgi:hypothetical protein
MLRILGVTRTSPPLPASSSDSPPVRPGQDAEAEHDHPSGPAGRRKALEDWLGKASEKAKGRAQVSQCHSCMPVPLSALRVWCPRDRLESAQTPYIA